MKNSIISEVGITKYLTVLEAERERERETEREKVKDSIVRERSFSDLPQRHPINCSDS